MLLMFQNFILKRNKYDLTFFNFIIAYEANSLKPIKMDELSYVRKMVAN